MRPPESFLGQPIRSLQTMLRSISDDDSDYERIIPDGIYGPETMHAVSRFQQNHGLPVTGITNQETWDKVVDRYESSLIEQSPAEPLCITMNPGDCYRKGEHHPNVALAQSMLTSMSDVCSSISPPTLSGTLDDATEDSICSFQQMCGLPMNGQLDKRTWKNLALQYPQTVQQKRNNR